MYICEQVDDYEWMEVLFAVYDDCTNGKESPNYSTSGDNFVGNVVLALV